MKRLALTLVALLIAAPAQADTLVDNVNGITLDKDGKVVRFTGMVIGTALRLARPLKSSPLGLAWCTVLGLSTFVMIALLRWPLVAVLLGLGVFACALAWRRIGREAPQA